VNGAAHFDGERTRRDDGLLQSPLTLEVSIHVGNLVQSATPVFQGPSVALLDFSNGALDPAPDAVRFTAAVEDEEPRVLPRPEGHVKVREFVAPPGLAAGVLERMVHEFSNEGGRGPTDVSVAIPMASGQVGEGCPSLIDEEDVLDYLPEESRERSHRPRSRCEGL